MIRKTKRKLPLWIKLGLAAMGLISAAVLVDAVVGRDGVLELRRQRRRHEALRREVNDLRRKMNRLEAELSASEDDPAVQERIAREKLGLVREGEVVYILQPPGEQPPVPPAGGSAPPKQPGNGGAVAEMESGAGAAAGDVD